MVTNEIRTSRRYSRSSGLAVLFSLPGLLLLISVVLAPLITGFYYSLTNSSLISSEPTKFVGLANYKSEVLTATFGEALRVSLLITFFSIFTQLLTGYVIAKVLARSMKGTSFFVSVIMLPMLLTPVAIGMMWSLMLNPDIGAIKWLQSFVGLDINFLSSSGIAVIVIIRSVNAFRMFDTIFVLTSGGPGNATVNLPFLAYKAAFTYFDTSRASAISVAIVAIVMPVYFIFLKMTKV